MPHKALWVNSDFSQEVKMVPGGYVPQQDEMLLKCICVGVNPADWKHSEIFGAVDTIEGMDAVGKIVQLGPAVTTFRIGQHVLTFGRGIGPACYGACQEYFLANASTSWVIDGTKISFEQAATIPLTICTACDALYNKMQPTLPLHWEQENSCNWPILLWGAASQVGIQATQFARLSGCNPIIVTASPKQHQYLKSLGADITLDYRDSNIEAQIRNSVPAGKYLRHCLDCIGISSFNFGSVVEPGGSIISVLPIRDNYDQHHIGRAIGGTIHNLGSFDEASFSYIPGSQQDAEVALRMRDIMAWTMKEVAKGAGQSRYLPPRVRKLSGRGMYDALEAFELMKSNKISGEKVVFRMEETPGLHDE